MDNIYHRYLNLPFEIARPPITYNTPENWEQISLRGKYEDHNLKSWLKKLGLECLKTEVFYTPPNGGVPIHTDDYDDQDGSPDNHVKINMTWGPEEATVRWWVSNKTYRWQDSGADYSIQPILLAKEEDSTLVFERSTNKPSLLNVGELHSTYNPSDNPRWTICFVPGYRGKMIKFETALKIFKKFIINE